MGGWLKGGFEGIIHPSGLLLPSLIYLPYLHLDLHYSMFLESGPRRDLQVQYRVWTSTAWLCRAVQDHLEATYLYLLFDNPIVQIAPRPCIAIYLILRQATSEIYIYRSMVMMTYRAVDYVWVSPGVQRWKEGS